MTRTETLRSPANPLLKEVRRATAHGSLTRDGDCIAEGLHILDEALRSNLPISAILAAESARAVLESRLANLEAARVVILADTLFQTVAATEASQGVIALVRPLSWHLGQLFGNRALVLVLDGLQDPGNAGAILRAAEAFSATGVIFLKGTVSPYNPKAVRASAGSLFRVPLVTGIDAGEARAAIEERRLDLYAAMPSGSLDLPTAALDRPCALIIGSEGHGVSEPLCAAARSLRIPVTGVESLNAAMAAGILLYEARRRRLASV